MALARYADAARKHVLCSLLVLQMRMAGKCVRQAECWQGVCTVVHTRWKLQAGVCKFAGSCREALGRAAADLRGRGRDAAHERDARAWPCQ